MGSRDQLTDDERSALALGPAAAAAAMMATSQPGFIGLAKEIRVGMKAIKSAAPTDPPAADLVRDLIAYAEEHKDIGKALDTDGDDKEAMRSAALDALDRAGLAGTKLSPEELDGYAGWLLDVARAMAEATSDKGEEVAVSSAEEQTLAEIERRLRRG